MLLAHAQQHQVHRQLEGQVLEEEREVEALVELDRHEDGGERELGAVGAAAYELGGSRHLRLRVAGEGGARRRGPRSPAVPGTGGAAPRSRKPRHAWPPGGSEPPTSVSKKPWPRISSLARPNSSSAGSDHLETAPCPSVRTKYPPTICRSSASSASGGPAPSAAPASTASGVLVGGVVEGFIWRVLRGRGLVRPLLHRQM